MQGHVYVFLNSSLPGLVKIGKTTKDPSVRARELTQTGVPTPFVVAYSIFVSDCDSLEADLHDSLSSYRESTRREFFRIDAKTAIDLLVERAEAFKNTDSQQSSIAENELKPKTNFYIHLLKPSDEGRVYIRKDLLDNEDALKEVMRAMDKDFEDADDNEAIHFYPSRILGGKGRVYRFGFTSLSQNEFGTDLIYYFVLLGMITSLQIILYEKSTPEFDLSSIMLEFSPHILSMREQLIFADNQTIERFKSTIINKSRELTAIAEANRERLSKEKLAREIRRNI